MKNSKSKNIGPKEPTEPPDFSFDEAMRKILRTPKDVVESAIEKVKKKQRGNTVKRD